MVQCFLLPEEIAQILYQFAVERKAKAMRIEQGNVQSCPTELTAYRSLEKQWGVFYLVDEKLPIEYILPGTDYRDHDWLYVIPGTKHRATRNRSSVLTCTDFFTNGRGVSRKFREWFKGYARQHGIQFGTNGKSFGEEGHYLYKDICYSTEAVALLKKGATWKQFRDGNVYFEPPANMIQSELLPG